MGKRKMKRSGRGSVSLLSTIFAIVPVAYVLTTGVSGQGSPLALLLGGGGSWQSINAAFYSLAQTVIQNWVTILIILVVAFVAIKITRKLGAGARITKHLRM